MTAERFAFVCPRTPVARGLGLVGEDRKRQGIVPEMSCRRESDLGHARLPGPSRLPRADGPLPGCPQRSECLRLWDLIRLGDERRVVSKYFDSLRVKAASPEVPIATLSGGNQQKLVLARWLARRTQVLLLDEPTRGVDVAAKAEIHRLIEELAAAGHAVLMISSELPEVLALSNRVLVMRQGRVAGIVARSEATPQRIMELMAGCGPISEATTNSSVSIAGIDISSDLTINSSVWIIPTNIPSTNIPMHRRCPGRAGCGSCE